MRRKAITSAVLAAGAVLSSSATFAADVQHGATIARRWCSSCHVVASNQRQVTGEAPPFATIARMPGFDEHRLAFFLLDPHPKMPDMGLSRTDAADLAAYIGSLGK
jgi:mono/diheme cytochrome c family protein